jgi:hypothetical protein
MYDKSRLNKETLIKDEGFLSDAKEFLIRREDYDLNELDSPEKVYDQFMEHFRYQNVNEITAIRDLNYVQDADVKGKEQFGRLMDTFDRMDSDLGLDAAQDYIGGVFSAPSTYAGMFSFGAGKAASLAGQQGIKWGIRQAIKSGGLRSAAGSTAVEATTAAGTVGVQEASRVEAGIKEEIDPLAIGVSGAIGAVTGGIVGGVTGTKRAMSENIGSRIARIGEKRANKGTEIAHKTATKKVFEDTATKETATSVSTLLIEKAEKDAAEKVGSKAKKASLRETVGEQIEEGEKILLKKGEGFDLSLTVDAKKIQNISAAVAKIDNLIPDMEGLPEGKIERLTSRFTKGISMLDEETIGKVLEEHSITSRELISVYPTVVSQAASVLGVQSGVVRKLSAGEKAVVTNAVKQMDELDAALLKQGIDPAEYTSSAKKELETITGAGGLTKAKNFWVDVNKARIGMMTIQLATTVRNTTNGYMRNYVHAVDNFGTGMAYLTKGAYKKYINPTAEHAEAEAKRATRAGVAYLKSGGDSLLAKDLVLGMESANTNALFKLLKDPKVANTKIVEKLLREMGDIADITGAEGGVIGISRKLNTLNTMSDNMFKRAMFARELDRLIQSKPVQKNGTRITSVKDTYKNLDEVLKSGNLSAIDDDVFSQAMETAFDFTYQTGNFANREGMFNKVASVFIDAASTPIGGMFAPFPRYMVNQLRFAHSHAPIIGLMNFGGILNKPGGKAGKVGAIDLSPEAVGKQLSGISILGTFLALRYNFGDETTGPFQYNDPTSGGTFDARASIGPFSAYAWAADIIYRHNIGGMRGEDAPVYKETTLDVRDLVQIFTGGQGRAGTVLAMVDKAADLALQGFDNEDSMDDISNNVAKFVGNYLNTYMVGAGMLKDVVASLDENYRTLPDNSDVDFFQYIIKQATRSLPIAPDEDRAVLESPTRSGGVKRYNPILKLVTGLSPQIERTDIEKELDRLNFDYVEISPRKIKGDATLSNKARGLMGAFVERQVSTLLEDPDYLDLPNDVAKRDMLKKHISIFKTLARNTVMNPESATTLAEELHLLEVKWRNENSPEQKKLQKANYKSIYGGDLEEDEAWWFAAESK